MDGEPLYYAKGSAIWKRPVRTKREDGTTAISIGFPVCELTEFVGTGGAQHIADALCKYESS